LKICGSRNFTKETTNSSRLECNGSNNNTNPPAEIAQENATTPTATEGDSQQQQQQLQYPHGRWNNKSKQSEVFRLRNSSFFILLKKYVALC
jgi:hypothetical protein